MKKTTTFPAVPFLLILSLAIVTPLAAESWVRKIETQRVTSVAVAPTTTGVVVGWSGYQGALAVFDPSGRVKASFQLDAAGLASLNGSPDGHVLISERIAQMLMRGEEQVTTFSGGLRTISPDLRVSKGAWILVGHSVGSGESLARTVNSACRNAEGFTYFVGDHGRDGTMLGKLDHEGRSVWTRTLDWPGQDGLLAALCTEDGGVVAGGAIGGPLPLVLRLDADGTLLWQKTFSTVRGGIQSLGTGPGGSILAAGTGQGAASDVLVALIDLDGTMLWARLVGSPAREAGLSAHVTPGSTIAIGAFSNDGVNQMPLAIELRPDGTLIRSELLPSAAVPVSHLMASGPDASGKLVFAAGTPTGVTVARWDGTAAFSCASSAGLTVTDLSRNLAEVTPSSPEPNTASGGWRESSPRDLETKVASVECGTPPEVEATTSTDELDMGPMLAQTLEKRQFIDQVWQMFTRKKWAELERMAEALRPANETWENGDWKIQEFYEVMQSNSEECPCRQLRDEWIDAAPEATVPRIAKAGALLQGYFLDRSAGNLKIAIEQIEALPDNLKDPDLARLRLLVAKFSGDEWWDEFVDGVNDFPGYYYLYGQATTVCLGDVDRLGKLIDHARETGRAMGWGDSLVARVMTVMSLYVDAREWPIEWKDVQKAYVDLFEVYPLSYKNMFRYGMVACKVKDRRVAASVFGRPELQDDPFDTEWEQAQDMVTPCLNWAKRKPGDSWAKEPPLEEDEFSEAEFVRKDSLPRDPRLAEYASRLQGLVNVKVTDWPTLVIHPGDQRFGGIDTGFFARASNSKMCLVTAFSGGRASALHVSQPDGTSSQLIPLAPRDGDEWSATLYPVADAPLAELRLGGIRPEQDMTVLVVTPDEDGQTVTRGLIFHAEGSARDKAARTFRVLLPPGSPLPPNGAPVIFDDVHLAGIVVGSSITDRWVVVECESAERVLMNAR